MHCVTSVRIRSYSDLHFPAFGLNNSKYRHLSRCDEMKNIFLKCGETLRNAQAKIQFILFGDCRQIERVFFFFLNNLG